MNSRVGKILEIHQEDPGRIHIVIVREAISFGPPLVPGIWERARDRLSCRTSRFAPAPSAGTKG